MTDNRPSIKDLWSNQATEDFTMSLDEIRARSAKFQRLVHNRNLREYAASVVVVLGFSSYVVILPGILTKLGSIMIILATLFVAWQIHRRGSARTSPLGGSVVEHMSFYRGELIRQRDALRSVAAWYLAPFVPGLIVFLTGAALRAPSLHVAMPRVLGVAGLCLIVFGLIWLLNRWGASRLQRQIDILEHLEGSAGGENRA